MRKKIFWILVLILIIFVGFWCFKNFWPRPQISLTTPTSLISPTPLLKFSVIGDPESDLPNLKKALELSKNNGDEFAVLVGDLTHVGSKKELREVKEILDQAELKYYAIPGNHDLYSAKKLSQDPTEYFSEIIGRPYNQVLIHNCIFLFIDNSDEEKGISQEQMKFIKKNLAEKGDKMLFIFLHEPVYHPDSRYLMGYRSDFVSKQRLELLDLFKTASPSAIFTGHLHHSSFWEKYGLKFYVAGAVTSQRNWQTPRFLEVKIFENGKFSVIERVVIE